MAGGLFKGRTAVVTGGARGIGLACAAKIAAGTVIPIKTQALCQGRLNS